MPQPPVNNRHEVSSQLKSRGIQQGSESTGTGHRVPNLISVFAFELAQGFSRFYAAHHILSEENETLRAAWLSLCSLALRELETLLDLLGIEVPERM